MPSIDFNNAPHSGLPMPQTESLMQKPNFNQENFHSHAINWMEGSQDPHSMPNNEYLHPQDNFTSQRGHDDNAPITNPMDNPYFMQRSNNDEIPRQHGQTMDAFTPRENENYGGQNPEQNHFQVQKKLSYGQPNATQSQGHLFNQNQGPPLNQNHNQTQNQNQNPRSHQSQGPAFKDKSGAEIFPPRLKDVTNPGSTFKKKQMAGSDLVRPQGNPHREMAKMAPIDPHRDPHMQTPNQHKSN